MQFNYITLGSVIRKLRIKRGLSQEVLSGLAGIARTHLTMIENGTKAPNLETLYRIAQALDMSASQLLFIVEQEPLK